MCDFYGPMGMGIASPPANSSAVGIDDEGMAMPDMDAMLDQLEREENECCEKGRQQKEEMESSPKIGDQQERIIKKEMEQPKIVSNSQKTTISIESKNIKNSSTIQQNENVSIESEEVENSSITEKIDGQLSVENPNQIEMANRMEREEEELNIVDDMEESRIRTLPTDESFPSPVNTSMEEGLFKANHENDDLFAQIDQMDLLIQAEEEKYATENLLTANEEEKGIGQNVPATSSTPSSVERFVEEMVVRICGQAISESHSLQKYWNNEIASIGCDFYTTELPQKSLPIENPACSNKIQKIVAMGEENEQNESVDSYSDNGHKTHELIKNIVEENKSEKSLAEEKDEELHQQKNELKEIEEELIKEDENGLIRKMDEENNGRKKEEKMEAFGREEEAMERECQNRSAGEMPTINKLEVTKIDCIDDKIGDKIGDEEMQIIQNGNKEEENENVDSSMLINGQMDNNFNLSLPNAAAVDEEEQTKILQQLEAQLSLEEEEQNNKLGEGIEESTSSPAETEMTELSQNQPTTSSSNSPKPTKRPPPQHALTIVHDLSVALDEFKLTESELTLGKRKPNWIPDEDCANCMLCSSRFSLINRRHHCRACGRVLCRICCSQRRQMGYMDEREGKQRVCVPCNRTLDRIEEYEKRMAETGAFIESTEMNSAESQQELQKKISINKNGQNEGMNSNSTEQNGMDVENGSTNNATSSNTNSSRFDYNSLSRKTTKSLLKPPRMAQLPSSNDEIGSSTSTTILTNENADAENSVHLNNEQKGEGSPSESTQNEEFTSRNDKQQMLTLPIKTTTNQTQQRLLPIPNNSSANLGINRRQVTFRDGVNPGQETPSPISPAGGHPSALNVTNSSPNPYQWLVRTPTTTAPVPNASESHHHESSSGKKLPRKISRRTKERRMLEEQTSLLQLDHWRLCILVDNTPDSRPGVAELQPRGLDQVVAELLPENGTIKSTSVNVAIRRNLHVRIEWRQQFALNNGQFGPIEVLAFSTRGMAAIGVDELALALELDRKRFSVPEEIEAELFCALEQFEQIFLTCLNSTNESMDYRMGIRKCASRMCRLYHPLAKKRKTLMGHSATAIYFHRPQNQLEQFGDLFSHSPMAEFLLGTIVREEELPWAKCSPTRLLLRLGLMTGQYPTPVVNLIRDEPAFTREAVGASVLKVLNDFRGWAYQMAQMPGTAITVRENLTEIWLPKLGLDEVRSLVESNRNMIGWAIPELGPAELEMEVDAHLVCKQMEDGHFCTHIFTKNADQSQRVTGASFIIFDGALKGGEQYLVSVVEDGLVCRLNADLMEELVKSLLAGDSFLASNSQGHQLAVRFHESRPNSNAKEQKGSLVSPIDGIALDGQFQYGLQLNRQLNAFNFFQYSTEWALRLATVINILPGKWPSALQPRFFDVCEKLAQQVANTVEPFLQELIAVNQLSICLRVHVDEDVVSYETERWTTLPDQHFVWTVTLDEQIIPFLYSLCAWIPSGFHVELQMPILSIRPLPAMNVPIEQEQSNESGGT